MTVAVGALGSYIGIGAEGTYGTVVARTRFLLHNSESLKPSDPKIESPSVHRVSRDIRRRTQSFIDVGGDFSFNPSLSSNAFTMLLEHALGTVATTQPDVTTAPTAYRHTFTPANALPTGLSIEVAKDQLSHLHSGCKVASLRLGFEAGQQLDGSVSIIGREQTSVAVTPLTLTDGHLAPITDTTLTWNGVSMNVLGGEFMIENALTTRHYTNSRYTAEPSRNGKRRVSGSFRVHLEDATIWSDFRNATERVCVITISEASIASPYNYDLVITANVSEPQDATAQADTEGPIVQPINFECFINSGNSNEVSLYVTNENAAA